MRRNLIVLFCLIAGFTISASQQSTWQWVNPLPQGNILNGIWITGKDTAIAVAELGGIIRTTNGGRTWQVQSYAGGTIEQLFGVQFVSKSVGWAVGETGRLLSTTDGGTFWNVQSIPTMSDLFAVSFTSSTTGRVVGTGGAIFRTTNGGGSWTPETSGVSSTLYSIFFLNPTTGWCVGSNGTIIKTTNGGSSWTKQTSNTTMGLFGVQFISSTMGFACGSFGALLKTIDGGTTWVEILPKVTDLSLYSINFSSALIGWAVGAYGVIIHTTNGGISWFEQSSETTNDLYAVEFSSSSTGWAVGDFGTIVYTSDSGVHWQAQSSGPRGIINGIHFATPEDGWAVGEEGAILRTSNGGTSWSSQFTGTMQTLYGVYFGNSSLGWAVGDSAVIYRTTNGGLAWSDQNSHTDLSLYSVYFTDQATGWVVGDFGTILRTNNGGVTWKAETLNTFASLLRVKFANLSIGWVVGYNGIVLKTTNGGVSWTEQESNTSETLYALDIIDTNTVVASGDYGTIIRTTDGGLHWEDHSTSAYESYYGITFVSTSQGWAVGDDGTLIATVDGGLTWTLQSVPTQHTLWDVVKTRNSTNGSVIFAAGVGGTILSASVSPLNVRTWTGAFDSSWMSPTNWNPMGIPGMGDSVVIPAVLVHPSLRSVMQQVDIAALNLTTGAQLTIGPQLAVFAINHSLRIDGSLTVDSLSMVNIMVGGSFAIGPTGRFNPGGSTVSLLGSGDVSGTFSSLFIASGAAVRSVGNITVRKTCTNFSTLTLRAMDTVIVTNPEPQAIQGPGFLLGGTIRRTIRPASTGYYQFESPITYIHFYPGGTLPSTIAMTLYANSLPDGFPDTTFVRRYYNITASGGSNFSSTLSLRYDTGETKIPIQFLSMFRDSGGVLTNMGSTDYLDSDIVAVSLDSVRGFSMWYLGWWEFIPRHPFEFADTLIVSDHGLGIDTLVFGALPGATDGIDSALGEFPLGVKPPPGVFDARWSIPPSNGARTDLRDVVSTNHTQNIYTCMIQPGPGGYPFTLRWNQSGFRPGLVVLQDQATGGNQFSIDMKSQSSFVISNPTVTAFRIVHQIPLYFRVRRGWNMVSLPLTPASTPKKSVIFPTSSSSAFGYEATYYRADTLRNGIGYWLKFRYDQDVGFEGLARSNDTISVNPGWNMIGSITYPVAVTNIVQIPSNVIQSEYYHFSRGYQTLDTIFPSKAYWVKSSQQAKLLLRSAGTIDQPSRSFTTADLHELNSLIVFDNVGNQQTLYFSTDSERSFDIGRFEMPPPPPGNEFDIRFSTNHLVEAVSESTRVLTVAVHSDQPPLTVRWHVTQPQIQSICINAGVGGGTVIVQPTEARDGSVLISNLSQQALSIGVSLSSHIPKAFSLSQNYPNPFNPSTDVRYGICDVGFVSLKVYDVLGREVATLVDEVKQPGEYTTAWNASNAPSGVYFYRLTVRDPLLHSGVRLFMDTKKMLLVK